MVRLLALVLNAPADNDHGTLELGKDLWEADEPALLQLDLTGLPVHFIEVGQPDEKRIVRVCRRVPKADRDEMVGEQVSRAWLATGPSAAAERQDKLNLLRSMVDAYAKAMQADGQLIAMGCSQGVLDRVQNLNWSPFHAGVQTVLKANGLADVIKP